MDTKNIFTPQLKKIKFNTVVEFNVPNYLNSSWIVRFDNKIKSGLDNVDLLMYAHFQEGGLTESKKMYPNPFDISTNIQFENLDTGEKFNKKGRLSKLLKKGFTTAIEDNRFKEHKGSWCMEFIYEDIKNDVLLPKADDIEAALTQGYQEEAEKSEFDMQHIEALKEGLMRPKDLKPSLADS